VNKFARVPVSGLVAQYNGVGPGDGTDRLPGTMRAILTKSLTVRGFINYDFAAEHYPAFLREVGAGIADGRIRYREDFVNGLERAPEAFIGMLEGRNFGKLIVRVDGGSKPCVRRPRGRTRHWCWRPSIRCSTGATTRRPSGSGRPATSSTARTSHPAARASSTSSGASRRR